MTLLDVLLIIVANSVSGAIWAYFAVRFGVLRMLIEPPLKAVLICGVAAITQLPALGLMHLLLGPYATTNLPFCLRMAAYWVAFYAVVRYFSGGGGWWRKLKRKSSEALDKLLSKVRNILTPPDWAPQPIPVRT